MRFKPAGRSDVIRTFEQIDALLKKRSKKVSVRVLGGASILLLGLRERATIDIDVAVTPDAAEFQKVCAELKIPVDLITIVSTVDLGRCPTVNVFRGDFLSVDSVTPKDLIKLKLERFYKQDPEDIYAIIEHESIGFEEFKSLVIDMLPDYIGNPSEIALSAKIVVEQIYPEHVDEFKL